MVVEILAAMTGYMLLLALFSNGLSKREIKTL